MLKMFLIDTVYYQRLSFWNPDWSGWRILGVGFKKTYTPPRMLHSPFTNSAWHEHLRYLPSLEKRVWERF